MTKVFHPASGWQAEAASFSWRCVSSIKLYSKETLHFIENFLEYLAGEGLLLGETDCRYAMEFFATSRIANASETEILKLQHFFIRFYWIPLQ